MITNSTLKGTPERPDHFIMPQGVHYFLNYTQYERALDLFKVLTSLCIRLGAELLQPACLFALRNHCYTGRHNRKYILPFTVSCSLANSPFSASCNASFRVALGSETYLAPMGTWFACTTSLTHYMTSEHRYNNPVYTWLYMFFPKCIHIRDQNMGTVFYSPLGCPVGCTGGLSHSSSRCWQGQEQQGPLP